MSNQRKASGRTAFGGKLGMFSDQQERLFRALPIAERRRLIRAERLPTITFGDRGCNFGGSGLRPLRFRDGRLRNRVEPKLYRQDGTRKN